MSVPDVPRKSDTSSPISGTPDIAVALHYDGSNTPRVTAKGEKQLAKQIIEAAEQAGVPLYPDHDLAMVLHRYRSAKKFRTNSTRRSPR